jgi:hypothetical protein
MTNGKRLERALVDLERKIAHLVGEHRFETAVGLR